ncbi:MAG: protein jag [Butyrivibrio sp.]|nr:protein jag [Butyrivibrio sp.]
MDYIEVSAKTLDDAITEACEKLSVTSDRLDYEVISNGSTGFLGLNSKPAIIKARVKEEVISETVNTEEAEEEVKTESVTEEVKEDVVAPVENKVSASGVKENIDYIAAANNFLSNVFAAMNMTVEVKAEYIEADSILNIELCGDDMGVLIGKRGQTLDSLQYLISLVVNKGSDNYVHVKVDTENYRERRKATLENLAKNISYKVRKTRHSVALEPMNPYERRIIHSALQNDRFVTTHSEGEEPFRRVVITLKK